MLKSSTLVRALVLCFFLQTVLNAFKLQRKGVNFIRQRKNRKYDVLTEYNHQGIPTQLVWDEKYNRFVVKTENQDNVSKITSFLRDSFIPQGDLNSDYFVFSKWRAVQRLVSATNNVFSTQALLLALGFNKKRIGLAAATTWVLKDALGKLSRVFWASKYGRKFDSDAKKWRFRSSILMTIGHALEILTYIFPAAFLLSAAIANAMKQVAMVTASSTRNTIYKSFSKEANNIGDITAKGEAQAAIVDILGLFCGIALSKVINVSKGKMIAVFCILMYLDLACIHQEIRSVVFKSFNFERANIVVSKLVELLLQGKSLQEISTSSSDVTPVELTIPASTPRRSFALNKLFSFRTKIQLPIRQQLTPPMVARSEQLLLPAQPGSNVIKSWSALRSVQFDAVKQQLAISTDEKNQFCVLVNFRLLRSWTDGASIKLRVNQEEVLRSVEGSPVVMSLNLLLGKEAKHEDIFHGLVVMQYILQQFNTRSTDIDVNSAAARLQVISAQQQDQTLSTLNLHANYTTQLLHDAYQFEKKHREDIKSTVSELGWDVSHFSFGSIKHRVEWQ